jgi:RNA polymerase sigma-70 factor (ECF subfamily)
MSKNEIIERYYSAHRGEILAFVSARIHNIDESEDLVQEAFLKLLSDQRPICELTLPSLVYTLCRHLVIDWYRHHIVCKDVEHELRYTSRQGNSAETLLSIHEIHEQMERGLARLPKPCGDYYRLHIYGGLQVSDICKETGEKYKTVENRLGQARKFMRNYLRHIS